eukprot:2008707-Amphidinium_carterae.1
MKHAAHWSDASGVSVVDPVVARYRDCKHCNSNRKNGTPMALGASPRAWQYTAFSGECNGPTDIPALNNNHRQKI